MSLLSPPLVNGLQKTLDAQLDVGETTSVALNNTTNIQNKPGVFIVNRIDSSGDALAAAKREYIKFDAVSGNTLTGLTRARGGSTDQDHAVGSVVEFLPDVVQQQAILDTIEAEHNTDGTHDAITATSIDLGSSIAVTATLDEDDMASNSATALATQQSIKAYVDNNPYGGWLTTGISGVTVTRASVDNPTVVLTFDADVTNYIWKGSRIKATENSIVYYFIVSADPTETGGVTTVTCLSEIDTTTPTQAKALLGATAISDVAYAPPKTFPSGFPISPESWTVQNTATDYQAVVTVVTNTWYNIGSLLLSVPIGSWELSYTTSAGTYRNATDQAVNIFSTLSTANNTESDVTTTARASGGRRDTTGSMAELQTSISSLVSLTAKSTRYLNYKTTVTASNLYLVENAIRRIRATSTLL
jgi:hypothetical protein